MVIGLLREPKGENRVALLPESVQNLIKLKTEVVVETGAGLSAFSTDKDYINVGAEILAKDEVIKRSDILVRICPPKIKDITKMHNEQVFVNNLNALHNTHLAQQLAQANITTFSMDMVPRTTRAQSMDVLSSMATIAGYKAVLAAAGMLPRFFPMFMTAAGTIRPAKVLILGAGVAGLQAIATARKLGAVVEAFDVRKAAKEEVLSLGAKFVEVEGARDEESAGGYAVEQTEEYKNKQSLLIQEHAKKANVVICTAQIPGKKAPVLITKETVNSMQPGSVIVDLAASTGGNCEVTKNNETLNHDTITIIGNSNFPSEMPVDASKMYGQNVINFLKLLIDSDGNMNLDMEDDIINGTCVTYQNEIVHKRVLNAIEQQAK